MGFRVFRNGEPWILKDKEVVGHICCDCELRHEIQIDINSRKKEVTLTSFRNDYETEQLRKKYGVVVYRRNANGKTNREKNLSIQRRQKEKVQIDSGKEQGRDRRGKTGKET